MAIIIEFSLAKPIGFATFQELSSLYGDIVTYPLPFGLIVALNSHEAIREALRGPTALPLAGRIQNQAHCIFNPHFLGIY